MSRALVNTEYSFPDWCGITIATMRLPSQRYRWPQLILAIALMLASAFCGLLYMDAVGKISGWIGLPKYEGSVPRLRDYAMIWSGLALALPFLAAFLLGHGKSAGTHHAETSRDNVVTGPEVSRDWTFATALLAYLLRVAAAAFTSVAFMVVFVFVALMLQKLGVSGH